MVVAKPGSRWRSVTCETTVVVVKAPPDDVGLECGGQPMVPFEDAVEPGTPAPGFDEGTQLGKRYTDDDATIEVLCTKGGAGSLALGGSKLSVKDAKPLPASD